MKKSDVPMKEMLRLPKRWKVQYNIVREDPYASVPKSSTRGYRPLSIRKKKYISLGSYWYKMILESGPGK